MNVTRRTMQSEELKSNSQGMRVLANIEGDISRSLPEGAVLSAGRATEVKQAARFER